jgi:PPM family protein phosphatase
MSRIRHAGDTSPGRKRIRNEDTFVRDPPLFAVADGMGGAQAGELASGLAADALRERGRGVATEERIEELLREANRRVFARANEDAAASGMGTTVTVALVEGDRVFFGHVGDSRAYLIREGELSQITDDHSLVAELVRSGRLSPEEAEGHPQRSVITRALGTDSEIDVDTFSLATRPADLFLICSDGLSSMVDDQTILEIAERYRSNLDEAVKALLAAANLAGGEDNITVVLFEITDGPQEPDERTLEAVDANAAERALEADEEDTLSELDRVPALTPPAPESAEAQAPHELTIVGAPALPEAPTAEPDRAPEEPTPSAARDEPTAGPLHKLLALLVIVGLVVLIVFLVVWGLAR